MADNIELVGKKNTSSGKKEKRLATDYAKNSGLKNSVNYKEGKVYVGGKEMEDFYVDGEGKAHVNKEEMDKAIEETKDNIGIKENVFDERINNTLSDIENTSDWSYNPEKDPAYVAYRDMYQREGQRAYEDAYSKMSSLTGGYESSAAVSSGAQQLNYYNSMLNDKLTELMEQSYDRYNEDREFKRGYLSDLTELDELQNEKNNDLYQRYNEAVEADEARTLYEAYTRHMNQNALERDNYDTSVYQSERETELENDKTELMENVYTNAYNRGYFTDEEAQILGIKRQGNGEYPSPYSGEVRRAIEMWNGIEKEKTQSEIDYETAAAIKRAYYGA